MERKEVDEPPDRRQVRHFLRGNTIIEENLPPVILREQENDIPKLINELCEACKNQLEWMDANSLSIISFPDAIERLSKMEKHSEEILNALCLNADLRQAFLENPLHFVEIVEKYGWENVREVVNHNDSS